MEVMYRFADLIDQNAFELGLLDSLDVGKLIIDMLVRTVISPPLPSPCVTSARP
jgi:hypothetical protein